METYEPLLPTPNTLDSLEPKKIERIVAHNQKARPGRSYLSQNLREVIYYGQRTLDGTSLQAVSPANHSPKLDEKKERQMTATSGQKCYELYESFLPSGSSVKTLAASLLGAMVWYSDKCSLTWKVKGTKSKHLLFQLSALMRRTRGTESGLLPTAKARDYKDSGSNPNELNRNSPSIHAIAGNVHGLKLQPNFVEWMMGYPIGWTELKPSEMPSSRKSPKK